MRRKLIVISIICIFLLTSFTVLPGASIKINETVSKKTKTITAVGYVDLPVEEAWKLIRSNMDVIVLDVREPSEYEIGHIPDVVFLPLSSMSCGSCVYNELGEYKDKNIVVYSISGIKSQKACHILQGHGFKHVYNMVGGITAWKDAGFSTVNVFSQDGNVIWKKSYLGAIPLSESVLRSCRLRDVLSLLHPFSFSVSSSHDWREKKCITPVKDQSWDYVHNKPSPCGSCWAFAAVAALEAHMKIKTGETLDLSEQQLLSCSYRNLGCYGGNAHLAYRALRLQGGIVPEECFPYQGIDYAGCNLTTGKQFKDCQNDPVYCLENLKKCGDWKSKRVTIPSFITFSPVIFPPIIRFSNIGKFIIKTIIKKLLIELGPAVAMMAVYSGDYATGADDFRQNYTGGIYEHPGYEPMYKIGKQHPGVNHQVVIVGYKDDSSVSSGGYWICKNSWGTDWGDDGFFKIAYGDCQIESHIIFLYDLDINSKSSSTLL